MARKFQYKSVPSTWIENTAFRLDCGPYVSGAIEARELLNSSSHQKNRLVELTKGGIEGLVNPGRITRLWVNDSAHGIPFLSSTDILQADLSNIRLIANSVADQNDRLRIKEGWTLITRSGTIGRMAYARSEMDGMACTEDVLRVIPDGNKVKPGYLYAYLSSRFGVPLIVSGTYGAIIQHIEPHHIADLPVPRLGVIEDEVHELVEEAARLRDNATQILKSTETLINDELGEPKLNNKQVKTQVINSNEILKNMRMEGFYYHPEAVNAESWARNHPNGSVDLGQIANVFDVPQFKHIYVDREYGLPFFTSGELFKLERKAEKHLSKSQTKNLNSYIIKRNWVLLARSGQIGGIIGRPQFTDSMMDGSTTSDHVLRIVSEEKPIPSGYLYAYLATPKIGYPLLIRTATGTSIPALWPLHLRKLPVVPARSQTMSKIDGLVKRAFEMRVKATKIENQACIIIEDAITA